MYQQTAGAVTELTSALDGGSAAFGRIQESASKASEIVKEFLGASKSLGDYLEGHTFDFKVNLPELPDWAIPGGPTPFELGLGGIADALGKFNGMAAPSLRALEAPVVSAPALRSLEMPSPAAAVRAVAESGGSGGGTVINNYEVTVEVCGMLGTKYEIAQEIREELAKIAKDNGGPDRLFR